MNVLNLEDQIDKMDFEEVQQYEELI
jgi:hypothetical protein